MNRTLQVIKAQQQVWAQKHGINTAKDGYVLCLNDNLFEPLTKESECEFVSGSGKELDGEKPKMKALHSSSALACNFFQYWRYRNLNIIAKACGFNSNYNTLRFERKCEKPLGIKGRPPNIDIEFINEELKLNPVAIESKFTEPYNTPERKTLKEVYARTPEAWGCLSSCRSLAKKIVEGTETFERLDAPQLLKHIVGLRNVYGEKKFGLLYLWFRLDGEETQEHEDEIKRFKNYIASEVDFHVITYQEIFQRLKLYSEGHQKYINYIGERYFE